MSDPSHQFRRFEPQAAAIWEVLRTTTSTPVDAIGAAHLVIVAIMASLARTQPHEIQNIQHWYRQLVNQPTPYIADPQAGLFRVSSDGDNLQAQRVVPPDQAKAEREIKKTVESLLGALTGKDDGAFDLGDEP